MNQINENPYFPVPGAVEALVQAEASRKRANRHEARTQMKHLRWCSLSQKLQSGASRPETSPSRARAPSPFEDSSIHMGIWQKCIIALVSMMLNGIGTNLPPDPPQTLSEELFVEFCTTNKLPLERIPRCGEQSADYFVTIASQRIGVEIKQMENDEDEERVLAELEKGSSSGWGGTIGTRIRNLISKGGKQLWNTTRGHCPGLLLLYDNRHQLFRYRLLFDELLAQCTGRKREY